MAKKVPTELGGNSHGHPLLVTNKTDDKMFYRKDIMQDVMQNPKVEPDILSNDSHAIIVFKVFKKVIALNKYHTQQGVISGLRDLIFEKFPKRQSLISRTNLLGTNS